MKNEERIVKGNYERIGGKRSSLRLNVNGEKSVITHVARDYDEAIKVIDLFIDDNSIRYNVEMFEIKINCYIKMGDYSKAKECIDKLISLNDKC